jgi:hypothetical protein
MMSPVRLFAALALTCTVIGPAKTQGINENTRRIKSNENRAIAVVEGSSESVAAVLRPGQLDATIITGVAQIGATLSVTLPPNITVGDVIAERCGKPSFATQVHPVYWDLVQELNPMESIASPSINVVSMRLPACVPFALKESEVGIEGGIEKLVNQLRLPFDFHLFNQLANEREKSTAVAKYNELKRNHLSAERNPCPPTLTLNQRFACINTIEFVYENRDRITTAARIQSPVRVLSSVVGELARIPIASDAASTASAWAQHPDEYKNHYRKLNGLQNVIPQASISNAPAKAGLIEGVESLNIIRDPTVLVPVIERPGVPHPARVPATTLNTSEGQSLQVTNVTIEPDVKFVGAVRNIQSYGEECSLAHEKRKGDWPFSVAKFVRAWAMHQRKAPNTKLTTLLIVDSGMDFLHDSQIPEVPERYIFPKHNFWTNITDQTANPIVDRDFDGIKANLDFSGVNLTSLTRSAATSIVDPNRAHGLAVTAISLGGRELEYYRNATSFPIRVSVASIVEIGTRNYVLNSQHITQGFHYATRHSFNVINLSLSTLKTPAAIDQLARQGAVVVAAAGNDGKEIKDAYPIWPAIGGGKNFAPNNSSSVIVTVGAHDAAGKLAGFSNKGRNYVDVLAPGCMVPSYDLKRTSAGEYVEPPRITTSYVSGTSFAAPTVSFLVAMIMSDPVASGPTAAKERIIVGTDFDGGLSEDVFASGVINVEKTLGHRYDLLEVWSEDGKRKELLFGEVLNKSAMPSFTCAGAMVDAGTIRKLAYDKANKKLLVFTRESFSQPASFERRICEQTSFPGVPLEFRNDETGEPTTYPVDRLIDYIPG